jgi:rhamnulokinase
MTRPGLTHAQLQVPFRSGGSSRQRLANFQRRLANRKFNRILIVGDGSRNRLLCRATADAAGLPVASYALEGAAVGNLASQFIALGAVKDLASFRHHLAHQLEPTIYHPCS